MGTPSLASDFSNTIVLKLYQFDFGLATGKRQINFGACVVNVSDNRRPSYIGRRALQLSGHQKSELSEPQDLKSPLATSTMKALSFLTMAIAAAISTKIYNNSMADTSNNEKYPSWKECCQKERGESGESEGWISKNVKPELSVFDDLPKEHAGKPLTFKELVVNSKGKNFILIPGGDNSVRCLQAHHHHHQFFSLWFNIHQETWIFEILFSFQKAQPSLSPSSKPTSLSAFFWSHF